jgi:hypothetical protein
MKRILTFTLLSLLLPQVRAAEEIAPPVHPDEAKILKQILRVEEHSVQVAEMPGWAKGGIVNRLKQHSIDTNGLKSWAVRGTENPGLFFSCIYNADGRVLALSGNGPWLRNDSLRALKDMPELRLIHIDHNGFLRNHPKSPLYSGTGFDALTKSKLIDVKLTLGINDEGLQALAGITGLKTLAVVHSQVTDEGLKHLEGHPSLESFTVAEMGKVSQKALASIAKMPKVTRVGFQEAFVTYEDGFALLAPLKGRLKELDLTMSVVNEDDLKRVQADHPDAKITTIPAEEIVKRHSGVANTLARISTGEAAEKLKKAIAEYQPKKK